MQHHQIAQRGLRERLAFVGKSRSNDAARALVVGGQGVERAPLGGGVVTLDGVLEVAQGQLGDALGLPVRVYATARRGDHHGKTQTSLAITGDLPALINATLMRAISSRGANGLMT